MRTHITKEREEVPLGPAESPIKQDVNTRKERELAKKVTTQRNYVSTTTSKLETQGMQDVSKRDVASPEEAQKIDPQVYQLESP